MKYACEKCGQTFDNELQCRNHEEEHRMRETPALGEKQELCFTVSLNESPGEGEGKYTLTYENGSQIDTNSYPSFYSNIRNMEKLVGKKVRVTCYAEIVDD